MNQFDLTGKTAAVTGASRGIGAAIALALAEAGADIVAISSAITDEHDIIGQVRALGRSAEAIPADLTQRGKAEELGAALAERGVDILVANAGIVERAPAEVHTLEQWDRVIEINLSSQFVLAQAVGRRMLEKGNGKIVFTASLLSFQGGINVASYSASKHGVVGITKALSNEWASRGINVNAIVPGYIATDNTTALRADPVRHQAILDRIPAGRWGEAEDMGGAAVFLSSAASDYVHGTTIAVDGGWLGR